jgi:hypothetical protein
MAVAATITLATMEEQRNGVFWWSVLKVMRGRFI